MRLAISHDRFDRWQEMIAFAMKDFGVHNDSDALSHGMEEYVRGRGRG